MESGPFLGLSHSLSFSIEFWSFWKFCLFLLVLLTLKYCRKLILINSIYDQFQPVCVYVCFFVFSSSSTSVDRTSEMIKATLISYARTHISMSYNRIKKINFEMFSHSWFGCIADVMLEWHMLWKYCTDFDGSHMVCVFFRFMYICIYIYVHKVKATANASPWPNKIWACECVCVCSEGKEESLLLLTNAHIYCTNTHQNLHTMNGGAPAKIYTIHTMWRHVSFDESILIKYVIIKPSGRTARIGRGRAVESERGNICLNSIHTVAINQNASAHTAQHSIDNCVYAFCDWPYGTSPHRAASHMFDHDMHAAKFGYLKMGRQNGIKIIIEMLRVAQQYSTVYLFANVYIWMNKQFKSKITNQFGCVVCFWSES